MIEADPQWYPAAAAVAGAWKAVAYKLGLAGAAIGQTSAGNGRGWLANSISVGHFVLALLGLVGTVGGIIIAQADRIARIEERVAVLQGVDADTRARQAVNETTIAHLVTEQALSSQAQTQYVERMAREHADIYAAIERARATPGVSIFNAPGNPQAKPKK